MALSRGVSPRPQLFVAQADAQPFAALLDAAVSTAPDSGAGASAASAQPNQQTPAADTGTAAQDGAAASASVPAGKAAQGPAAPDNGAPVQSANTSAMQGAAANNAGNRAADVNDAANLVGAAPANGMPIQIANAEDTHHTTATNGGGRKPGPTQNLNLPAIMMPAPQASANGNPNASSGTSANPTPDRAAPGANDPAAADPSDAGKTASNDAAAAFVAAGLADLKGATSADGVTPGATADGKDDRKDQQNGSAGAAADSPAANLAQLSSPAPAQPLAAAVVVNAAPDSAPPMAAKPGLAIADAVKARAKVALTSAATAQTAPAQDDSTDAPGPAVDSAGTNDAAASSGSDDPTGNASAANAQQATDQLQTPGAGGLAVLTQIDFTSLGGTEHFGWRGETAASLNAASGPGAPNGSANAATAPNFGIFGLNPIATNMAAPAAAASEPAVPLDGLAVAIAGRAQSGASQFDIRLDPPELGRIDVRLDVDGSGQVRTHVTVDRADTLQLLQSQQPQLERALEQAGLKTADNGLQFTLRDQSFAGQNGGAGGQQYPNQPAAPVVFPDIDAVPIDTAQIYARLRLGKGLDISV